MMGLKYIAGGKDISGEVIEIRIYKEGYSGSSIEIKMASSPLLRMDNGGRVKGTSLEFTLISETAGQLSDLYTTDPYELQVQLSKGSATIWTGYILREQYGEEYIEAPYPISLTATDGLGVLKELAYNENGIKTPLELFYIFFNKINLPLDLLVYSTLSLKIGEFLTRNWFDTASFDCANFAIDYYEALEKLLETINAYITQRCNQWVVERTPDITSKAIHYSNGNYIDEVSPNVVDIKPVGALSLVIEPSKKDIEITSYTEFPESILKNHLFKTDLSEWSISTAELQETDHVVIRGSGAVRLTTISNNAASLPFISQNVSIGKNHTYVFTLDYSTFAGAGYSPNYTFAVEIYNRGYRLTQSGWVAEAKYIQVQVAQDAPDVPARQRLEIRFQDSPAHFGFLDNYSIKIKGINLGLRSTLTIYEASLSIEAPREKYLDVIINEKAIDNADDFGIHISDQDNIPNSLNYWRIGGNATTQWQHITSATLSSFQTMMAKDIISNHLVTRVRLSGSIEEIGDVYFDSYGDKNYLAESYDYDLLNKVVSIELIELSAFHDLTLAPFIDGEYSTGGGSSGGGGSTGGGGVQLGETEFTAYRGDRGKVAYEHSQDSSLHFDTSSGTGKITKAQGASLVTNLGDGSAIATQVDANKTNITANTTAISTINTTLGNYAAINGDITKPFSASQLTTSKIILNGVELTIEAV
jgi:hypothetical protein